MVLMRGRKTPISSRSAVTPVCIISTRWVGRRAPSITRT